MANTAIEDLINDVQKRVPKCPVSTVIDAYRRGVRQWCSQTRWLRQLLPAAVEENVATYDILADPLLEIVDIPVASIQVTVNGRVQQFGMKPSDPTNRDPNAPNQRPFTYSYLPEGAISFYYTPDKAYDVFLTLALQPTKACTEIDTTLLTKHFAAFEAGALEYLLRLPEAWKDNNEANRNLLVFQASINNAKADVARGYQSGTVMVRKRAWIV